MCLLALFLTWSSLTEQATLEELRVSVVLDAAQTDNRVLFVYYDLGQGGLSRHYALYDIESEEVLLLEDGRIAFTSDAIVSQKGVFYAEANERVLAIDADGSFREQLRLESFEGWHDGLSIEAVEHEGDRVVALCQILGDEENPSFLAQLDFAGRRADIVPITLPRSNRFTAHPEFEVVPFDGQFLRIEVHTAEVVLLDASLKKKKTLQPPQETWSTRDRVSGHQRVVEVFTKPFITTHAGVTGKFLFTRDGSGESLDECIPGGFRIARDQPIDTAGQMIIGSTEHEQLLWNRVQETLAMRRSLNPVTASSTAGVAED